jgi:hypothetical protein
MKNILLATCLVVVGVAANARTICDIKLEELQDYALAAKYEALPAEQRGNFFAQLPSEKRFKIMGLQAGHGVGSALANAAGANYGNSLTDIFNEKLTEFKTKCGFMLQ